jgi:hypothetical protein
MVCNVTDDLRAVVASIISLIREHGDLPPAVRPEVDTWIAAWRADTPDPALLSRVKDALWVYLAEKHGDTTTISGLLHG